MAFKTSDASVRRYRLALWLLVLGGCNCTCAVDEYGVRFKSLCAFAYLMMGPFSGWAIIDDAEVVKAWPVLAIATLTCVIPLAIYSWARAPTPRALVWAALAWSWWGFYFTIAIHI